MALTETKIPADKLPAFYEALCGQLAVAVERIQEARQTAVLRAQQTTDPKEQYGIGSAIGTMDACLAILASAYARAAYLVNEPVSAVGLAQRYA